MFRLIGLGCIGINLSNIVVEKYPEVHIRLFYISVSHVLSSKDYAISFHTVSLYGIQLANQFKAKGHIP